MAGTNNEGMGGTAIEHIALEKTTLIGMQSPNEFPSTREGDDRITLPSINISGNKGCDIRDVKLYDCEPIDTSWLSYGGKYTLGVGNKWHVRVGGGGIHTETIGPIMNDGEIFINNAKKGFFVQTELFQVVTGKRGMMAGTRMDFNFDETYFQGNVNFMNNVSINGGLYVNGELMCNHMTTQKQMNMTEFNEDSQSFINPAMSFHIFQGQSLTALKYTPKSLLGTTFEGLDVTDADDNQSFIEAEMVFNTDFIEQILPGLDAAGISLSKLLLSIPIKIKFPKGISLISDATDFQQPEVFPLVISKPRIPGEAITKSDTFGPGHTHQYAGPACNYVADTQAMYQEAQKITQAEPLKHKQTIYGGAESIDAAKNQIIKMGENYIKKYVKKFLNWFNPFSTGT